jgi:hypothetical protein
MKLGQALNPRAAHGNTLVMRSSQGGDEDQAAAQISTEGVSSRQRGSRALYPGRLVFGPWEVGSVTVEIELPEDWTPGLGIAVAKMIHQSLKAGFPVVVPVRSDVTPDELAAAFSMIKTVIQRAGLAA